MLDLKPYGAFVENTIRPLLSEIKILLDEHDLDAEKWTKIVWITGIFHTIHAVIRALVEVSCVAFIAWIVWTIY